MNKLQYEPPTTVCANDENVKFLMNNSQQFDSYGFEQWKVSEDGTIKQKTGKNISFTKYYGTDVHSFNEGRIGLFVQKNREMALGHSDGVLRIQPFKSSSNFAWQIIYIDNLITLFNDDKYVGYDAQKDLFVLTDKPTFTFKMVMIKGIKTHLKTLSILNKTQENACIFPRESLDKLSLNRDNCYNQTDIGLKPYNGGCLIQQDNFANTMMKASENFFIDNYLSLQVMESEISRFALRIINLKKQINHTSMALTDMINEQKKYTMAHAIQLANNARNAEMLREMKDNCTNRSYLVNQSRKNLCTDIAFDRPNIKYASVVDNCASISSTSAQQWRYDPKSEHIRWMARTSGIPMCLSVANNSNVELTKCENVDAQKWKYDAKTRELKSGARCLGIQKNKPGENIIVSDCVGNVNQKWNFTKEQPEPFIGDCSIMAGDYNRTFKKDAPYKFQPPGSIEFDKNTGKGRFKQGIGEFDFICLEQNLIKVPDMDGIEGKGNGIQIEWNNGDIWKKQKEDCSIMAGNYNRIFKKDTPYEFQPPGSIVFDKNTGTGKFKQGISEFDFICLEKNLIKVPDMDGIEGKGNGSQIKWNNGNVWKKEDLPVLLFEHYDYQGRLVEIQVGSYPNPQSIGIIDNSLSSIRIPPGRKVILYEHNGFGGRSIEFTESVSSLKDYEFDNKTSSMRVM